VGLLGGELTVASLRGRGSTFTAFLPAGRIPVAAPGGVEATPAQLPAAGSLAAREVPIPDQGAPRPGAAGANARDDGVFDGLRVLLVDDDFRSAFAMTALLERGHAEVKLAESGAEALAALQETPDFDIVLMDIMMPVMDGYATIRAIRETAGLASLPIIAVTGKAAAGERQRCLEAGANDYVPKPVDSVELLGILRPWLPTGPARRGPSPAPSDAIVVALGPDRPPPRAPEHAPFGGLKILIVDDDYRNIFAMTALLERGQAEVSVAESGAEALALLERTPDIDVVLMDIMMPVMDGYATMRAIREMAGFGSLPIIAVTGKAAAGERKRCLDAGANEYIPKPVDSAALLAALRPWLAATVESAA
jgi:CheY-like chemotaxis protein